MGISFRGSLTFSSIMKVAIILFACVAVALSQHGPGGDHGHNNLGHLVHEEVIALLKNDANLSVDDCEKKCDAVFNLLASHSEALVDDICKHACECEILKNCDHHHGTGNTHAPHHGPGK